jgi:hypothetical protein
MILSSHGLIGSQITQFVGLLDLYPSAAAAYSLRKLRNAYTGDAIRVRRTDLAESDIGFTSTGALDTTALLAFTGTGALNNGFITTWYDQSGNARNATQTTAINQPQIVSSGSVLTLTGLGSANPCIRFDGINDFFIIANTIPISTGDKFSIYQVDKKTTSNSIAMYISGVSAGNISGPIGPLHYSDGNIYITSKINSTTDNYNFGALSGNNYNLFSHYSLDSTTSSKFYVNNTILNLSSSSSQGRVASFSRIGNRGAEFSNSSGQELIFYLSDQFNNNSAINSNINTYYGIY